MKTRNRSIRRKSSAFIFSVVIMVSANAQTIVGVGSSGFDPSRADKSSSSEKGRPPISSVLSALSSEKPLFQRGPLTVHPHLMYRATYGDGIEAGPGNQRDSYVQSLAPGMALDIGKHWRFDYTPTWTFYSNAAFRDTVSHAAILDGRTTLGHAVVGVAQSYESSYAVLTETGRQTHQEKYSTLVNGSWRLGQHTVIETSANRSSRYANAVADAPEWTTSDWVQWSSSNWLRYQFSTRLETAVGITVGYAQIGVGADMSFTQPQVQLTWKPADKIFLTAQAGQENRVFETGAHPRLKSPTYSAAAAYQFLPTTKLSCTASRSVSASYFANEIAKTQGWAVGLEQRLVQRLYLDAGVSGTNTAYLGTQDILTAQRADRYRALNVRLTTVVLRRTSLAVLYQTGRNYSDEETYAYQSNQYGVELSVQF